MYLINWKMLLFLAASLVVLILAIRGFVKACAGAEDASSQAGPTAEPIAAQPTRSPLPVVIDYEAVHSTWIKVYFADEGAVRDMLLEEYLIGVVAGEVPASYAYEAIKAQAVAARTYSLYSIQKHGCNSCDEADICTSSSCCQAYCTDERMKEKWGEEYAYYYSVIASAVMDTAGEVLLYDGKVIDALYHASSGGFTEDSEHVYSNAIPYLRSVESPHEVGSRLEGEKTFTRQAFVSLVNGAFPNAGLEEDKLFSQVEIMSTYASGRVELLRLGDEGVTGKQARKVFGLDSSLFTVEVTEEQVIFYTKGFGHGVGMSQSGANGMALDGADYKTILLHYYTGVTIGVIGQF